MTSRTFSTPSILLLALSAALAACGPSATEEGGAGVAETPSQTVTSTRLAFWPSWTPPPHMIPTTTATLDPPDAIMQKAVVATRTAEQATEIAKSTQVAGFPENCGYDWFDLISPDGNWLASSCYEQNKILIVTNRDGSNLWSINRTEWDPYQDDPRRWSAYCEAMPIYWSNDSRFIYFTMEYCIAADIVPDYPFYGYFEMPPRGSELFRLDTWDGTWHQETIRANYYSFSPTGRRLVYAIRHRNWYYDETDTGRMEILIIDLQNGEYYSISLENTLAAGYVVWSGDGLEFYFGTVKGPPSYSSYTFDYQITSDVELTD